MKPDRTQTTLRNTDNGYRLENIINTKSLGIFPLPVYLLPGGITKLKVFEPRYVRLIKESATEGFALSVYKPELDNQTSPWGVHVDIIDFDLMPGDLLVVVIKARELISITDISTENDGLRRGTVESLDHWPEEPSNADSKMLADALLYLMEQNASYGDLYANQQYNAAPNWQSPTWVNRRWLEVLPMSYEFRSKFIYPGTFSAAQNYIKTMLLGLENSTTIKS